MAAELNNTTNKQKCKKCIVKCLWGKPCSHNVTSQSRVILASVFTKFRWLQFPAFMSRNVSEISRRSNSCLQTSFCSRSMNNILDKIYSKIKYICCKTLLMTINICFKPMILYENTLNLAKIIVNFSSGESLVLNGHCLENETTDHKKKQKFQNQFIMACRFEQLLHLNMSNVFILFCKVAFQHSLLICILMTQENKFWFQPRQLKSFFQTLHQLLQYKLNNP